MRKVRVLFITPGPLLGGGATVSLYRLIKHLDRQKYDPIILAHECGKTDPYLPKLRELAVKVLCLKPSDGIGATSRNDVPRSPRFRRPWVERLAAWKRRHRLVETIYDGWRGVHHFLTVDVPRCVAIARILRERQVELVHLNNALCSHRGGIMAARLVGVPSVCHIRIFDKFEAVDALLLKWVGHFVYMSRALEAHVQARRATAAGSVVYDGLDLAEYLHPHDTDETRAEFGLSPDDFVVGNVGRLVGWKGQDVFIRAVAEISHEVPNLKALIVGRPDPGREFYLDEVKALAAALGLTQRVVFTGFRTDVPRLLASMDLVVHSSSRPEPFGIVVIEGMAAGKPVIATQAGGPLDIIEEGVDGLLVPPGDATAMGQAILCLYEDWGRASAIGEKAREKALKRFTVERFAAEIQDIFAALLETSSARAARPVTKLEHNE